MKNFEEIQKEFETFISSIGFTNFEKLQNNHYVDKNLDKFWLSFCEQYKEAKLGCVAISFVDRAGDTHPGIDDAETICKEFYEEMSKALNTWYPLPIRVKKS
jgi:tRNA(Ile)-lysidine synthase TilS/MesJ